MAAKKRKVNVDLADIEARVYCQEQAHLETMAQMADLDARLDWRLTDGTERRTTRIRFPGD